METNSSSGVPHLHAAAKEGKHDLVQQLLAAGADVDEHHEGRTPLHEAVQAGHAKVVQVLLAAGADVDAKMPPRQHLLRAGASLEAVYGEQHMAPLTAAAFAGHVEVVRMLLAAGALAQPADAKDVSPLEAAIQRNSLEVMQLLLRSGADPRRCRYEPFTCLEHAACIGSATAVQLLLEGWEQPAVTSAVLVKAARLALSLKTDGYMAKLAFLAKELRKRYPADLQQLFQGLLPIAASTAVAAVVDTWASDVSSIREQQAALRKREEGVAKQQQALQQLVVSIAGMARGSTKQEPSQGS